MSKRSSFDINSVNADQFTTPITREQSLRKAAKSGNLEALAHILATQASVNKVNVNSADEYGMTALHYAAMIGSVDCITELLQRAAPANVNAVDDTGCTPLMFAATHAHFAAVHILLKSGAKVNLTSKFGMTALMKACNNTNLHAVYCVEELIEHKAKVNARSGDGMTALMMAVSCNNVRVIETLCESGAELNACLNDGRNALSLAISAKCFAIVSLLVSLGANADEFKNANGDNQKELKSAILNGIALQTYKEQRRIERAHRRQQSNLSRQSKAKAIEAELDRKEILVRELKSRPVTASSSAAQEEVKEPSPEINNRIENESDLDESEGEPVAEDDDAESEIARKTFRAATFEKWERESQSIE